MQRDCFYYVLMFSVLYVFFELFDFTHHADTERKEGETFTILFVTLCLVLIVISKNNN